MKAMVLGIFLSFFIGSVAFAVPEVEYIGGSNTFRVSIPVGTFPTKTAHFKAAAERLLNQILAKSSFADLTIDSSKQTSFKFDNEGAFSYLFKLSDKDKNQFTGRLNLIGSYDEIENPRTGKVGTELRVRLEPIWEDGAHVVLSNVNDSTILRVSR